MSKAVTITLNSTAARRAAKALGMVPGSDEFKEYSGPSFYADVVDGAGFNEGGTAFTVRLTDGTQYIYPLQTISRVKVHA